MKFLFKVIRTQENSKVVRENLDILLYEYLVWLVTNAFHQIFLLFSFLVCCRILFPVLLELGVVI